MKGRAMQNWPAPQAALRPHLDRKAWLEALETTWWTLGSSYFQHERLQSYQEPENPSFRAFSAGDTEGVSRALNDAFVSEEPYLLPLCRKGIPYVRVHAIERPLTPYLHWELAVYQLLARYGQRILLLDLTEIPATSPLWRTYDFLLFDEKTVMVQDYGQDGLLCGGWVTEDAPTVRAFADLAREIQALSVPLAAFERAERLRNNPPKPL